MSPTLTKKITKALGYAAGDQTERHANTGLLFITMCLVDVCVCDVFEHAEVLGRAGQR